MPIISQTRLAQSLPTRPIDLEQQEAWKKIMPTEQQEAIQKFITDLQTSVDSAPSKDGLEQWQTTIQTTLADDLVTVEEWQAIAQAALDIFASMGLTNAEVRTLAYDLQNIAEDSRRPGEDELLIGTVDDDLLKGKTGADTLTGTPTTGTGEIDILVGGGGMDTFVLGDVATTYYDDSLALTLGVNDYALIVDFNVAEDTIQLHGAASDYRLGALPAGSSLQGTALYRTAENSHLELVGIVMGIEVADFSQGFTFV